MTLSKEFRMRAWETLRKGYGKALAVAFLLTLVSGIPSSITTLEKQGFLPMGSILYLLPFLGALIGIFLISPLSVGAAHFFTKFSQSDAEISDMAIAFREDYWNTVKIMFIMGIKVFLWMLLLIVPGIIKAYEYSMIPYIVAENTSISTEEAFLISRKMMTGNKWRLFKLQISFIGWYVLGVLACGIGTFFVTPYFCAAMAEFYLEMKKSSQA